MNKMIPAVIIALIILSTSELAFIAHPVNASANSPTLQMTTSEDVVVSENGVSQISILVNVSSGPLADLYRKALGASASVGIEEQVPIPENATPEHDASTNVTNVLLPVREGLYESVVKEQLLSLGLRTDIGSSGMIPRGNANECRVMINALGSFENFNVTTDGSNQIWEVGLGPFNTTGITGLILTRLMFAQMMLESIPGAQEYDNFWHVRISLPAGAVLYNQGTLYNWTTDFGGGTYLYASASLNDASTILIDENIVITNNNVTVTPENLADALSTYKTFKVTYSLAAASNTPIDNPQGLVNTNFSHQGDTGWVTFPDISLPVSYADSKGNSLDLRLTISPTLRVVDYVGWQLFTDWSFPFVHLDKFWALVNLSASIGIKLEANATLIIYDHSWNLYHGHLIYAKQVYDIPVVIYIDFTIDANLVIKGNISFVAQAVINGEIDTGVRWDHTKTQNGNNGWEKVYAESASANVTDLTWQLAVGISITPGLSFRIEFLFYGVVGPFVEFDPYININEVSVLPNATILWDITVNFDIHAGVTINGWIRNMFGISDWNWFELSLTLWQYSGSWNAKPQPVPREPGHELQIVSINVSPAVIMFGNDAVVNVTIRNSGDYNETSDVTLFQETSLVDSVTKINFTSGEDSTFSFNWNSAILATGSYVLKGFVTPVSGENNTADNEMNMTTEIVADNDIAVVDLKVEPDWTYVGWTANITVVIGNLGELTEDSNVAVNANGTAIETRLIAGLGMNQNTTMVFNWNTSRLKPGRYVVWANITTLHYDINMANNDLTSVKNVVDVRRLGDFNGDGTVDISDAIAVAASFGSFPGHSRWNSSADLNQDGTVDIFDIIIVARNFEQT